MDMAQDRSLDRNNNGDREFRPSTGRNHSLDWDKRERAPDYRWAHDRNTGDNRAHYESRERRGRPSEQSYRPRRMDIEQREGWERSRRDDDRYRPVDEERKRDINQGRWDGLRRKHLS